MRAAKVRLRELTPVRTDPSPFCAMFDLCDVVRVCAMRLVEKSSGQLSALRGAKPMR